MSEKWKNTEQKVITERGVRVCGHEEGWKGGGPRIVSSADKTRRVSGSWGKAETGQCALNIWFYTAELLQTTCYNCK